MFSKIFWTAIALSAIALGCDEGRISLDELDVDEQSHSLKGDEAIIPDSNGPSSPIALKWQEIENGSEVLVSGSTLTLQNVSKSLIELMVVVEFAGLRDKIRTVNLGKHILGEGDSENFIIDAVDFPVQCHNGACQIRAVVSIIQPGQTSNTEEINQVIIPSKTIYYRHTEDYSKVYLFTEKFLIENNGHLWGRIGNEAVEMGVSVGRVKNLNDDSFEELYSMSDEMAVTVDGEIIGWVTGADISIDYDVD